MNVFSYVLSEDSVEPEPAVTPRKFVIEDNVGESIHIHMRNIRIELSVDEFDKFADAVGESIEVLDNGDY